MSESCSICGQPLPEIMSCDDWKKAGEDLVRQLMQPGGLIEVGNLNLYTTKKGKRQT